MRNGIKHCCMFDCLKLRARNSRFCLKREPDRCHHCATVLGFSHDFRANPCEKRNECNGKSHPLLPRGLWIAWLQVEECEAIAKSDTRSTAPTTAAVEDDDDVEITQVAPAQETKHARAFSFLSRALPPPRPLHLRLRLPFFVLAACLLALSVSAIILRKQLDSAGEGGCPLQGF